MSNPKSQYDPICVPETNNWTLSVPVTLVIFNRPEKTRKVLEQVLAVDPPKLLVIADGPRRSHPRDREKCEETRKVVESVDLDIEREYASNNLGLRERLQTGLGWVFDKVERTIILEDDCVPSESFFKFCECMLREFDGDNRVMDVCGTNHLGTWNAEEQDYLFTRFGGIWGWATWRETWEEYDPSMQLWGDPAVQDQIREFYGGGKEYEYMKRVFQRTYDGKIDTWDFQWKFARALNDAYTVIPTKNLVTNVGFGEDATHTDQSDHPLAAIPRYELDFPLRRKPTPGPDIEYDRAYYEHRHTIWERSRLLRPIKQIYLWLHDRS